MADSMTGRGDLSQADLFALVEDAKELTSEIDMFDLLHKILERAGQLTDSQSGSVILYDEERKGLYFAAATGPKAKDVLEKFGETGPDRVPVDGSKAGQVFVSGESLVQQSVEADPGHFKGVDREIKYQTDSMVCVLLAIGAERLGVVQLLNKVAGNYTPRDVLLLEYFGSHAAVAIRNARHFRDLLAHKGLFTSPSMGRKTSDLLRQLDAPAKLEHMTVLFADMRGFTRLSRDLGDPMKIQTALNEFLTLLASQVVKQEGLVNKFLGDGVLALFRGADAEMGSPEPERRAVRCAFGIVEGFAELKEKWDKARAEDLGYLDVGVGIVTGEVIIGSVGSGRVKDFTVLGNCVNLAAAFEQQARDGKRILIDQITFNAAREIIAEPDEPPVTFELRKPDQPSGTSYKRYHITRLKPAVSDAVVTMTGSAAHAPRLADISAYYSNSWAIVVGVDSYRSPQVGRLSYAVADAKAVAKALPKIGFPAGNIVVLENQNATKEAIQRAIYAKLASTNRDDRLLIFFALHGQVVKQHKGEEGFLLPYDVDPANLPLSALPMKELSQIGQRLPPKHILFVLDTCFSGYAAKRDMASSQPTADLRALTQEPVVQLLTAGTSDQKAIEEGGHGIFTRNLLKGLEGWADRDGSGLTALKLAGYVLERVMADSDNRQTPQYVKLDGEGEFLFSPASGKS